MRESVGHVVLGIEADGAWANIAGSATANITALPGTSLRLRSEDEVVYRKVPCRLRLDNWLLYTTFGVAALKAPREALC